MFDNNSIWIVKVFLVDDNKICRSDQTDTNLDTGGKFKVRFLNRVLSTNHFSGLHDVSDEELAYGAHLSLPLLSSPSLQIIRSSRSIPSIVSHYQLTDVHCSFPVPEIHAYTIPCPVPRREPLESLVRFTVFFILRGIWSNNFY